ncbi:MAG: TIGR03746 family integrating conjugative element protein [Cellvibrionaceae bacterium]|nr:TIGR03746 family integrating conjugative element protein [Cellvibrionaceae bacterium]
MSDTRHGISSRDSHIWSLRIALILSFIMIGALIGVIFSRQNHFTIGIPPDLSQGALVKPGEFQKSTAYVFALHVWRELNDWKISGKKDYPARVKVYECYVTPSFHKWLLSNIEQKDKEGELDRARRTTLVSPFREALVTHLGANTFSVTLDINLIEDIKNREVKNIAIRYPLRVVPDYRSCNRFGMSLDGFAAEPSRITSE